ncbi:hypothetical protein METP2_00526 [Methanosarcinales archaeon]|uniref:hypothetical protein n=1 Tax=Candidatus Methanoperedens sp. BLZ2 TaxID=2035255 RepID=UPI000BE23BF7|nr:hypothetical protein [Candidatus Methanoperedens sp. BLZ2]KAB2946073.1 MAG: hypothetical protein F9K14_08950 [Candidatus Methanoperedens sp.]MBZ0175015.1 hypothetical protein [Candidatus Methanoperedens nitroreducens]CAG0956487.1 hypothetical protein METP2_00526 [Methanosarcinales archaeon]MCX9076634.1 hypothetical protein [Candidatus Methanoperedens sp.]MCX9089429.1 hypothetical protein [Candidatus Methanoperedens sp.]
MNGRKFNIAKFEITEKQQELINQWFEKLTPKILEMQKEIFGEEFNRMTKNGEYPYYVDKLQTRI